MEERFNNFEVKRAEMFRELIKRAWYGNLDNQDLNEILTKCRINMVIKIMKFHF